MEQCTLKNVNNCLNTDIYSYLETSGGQSSNPYLNAVHFSTPEINRNLWQLKTAVFLHWCLICALPLSPSSVTKSIVFCHLDVVENRLFLSMGSLRSTVLASINRNLKSIIINDWPILPNILSCHSPTFLATVLHRN